MRQRISAVVWWLAAIALAVPIGPPRACAQAPNRDRMAPLQPIAPEADEPRGISTREMVRRLNRGKELLSEKNYAEGSRLLQSILECDEDAFFFADAQSKTSERSLKLEAQSLLGRLPPEGREAYEKQHGPAARRLLEAAIRLHDGDALGLVARTYLLTQAGIEAAYRIAGDHLDHERLLSAALCFERLRSLP
ncbi:MAG TPA: hypothetical protein VKU82_14525, partial [Planctomycetaceae bacterium]|nr:hypothetical protein [Planctomycetaceae bacterium]